MFKNNNTLNLLSANSLVLSSSVAPARNLLSGPGCKNLLSFSLSVDSLLFAGLGGREPVVQFKVTRKVIFFSKLLLVTLSLQLLYLSVALVLPSLFIVFKLQHYLNKLL